MATWGPVKIVFFDALFTLVQPRRPIYEQYHRVLTPHIGPLDKDTLKGSFKTALGELQKERPVYRPGKTGEGEEQGAVKSWWREVIRRTAVGAGADPRKMDEHLDAALSELFHVFSSREGYKLTDGALETLSTLNNELGVRTGLVSNADSRILKALEDLGATAYLDPMVISELVGIEKPDARIWEIACRRAGISLREAVHVGDEYDADVLGAAKAGMRSIWFCPPAQETHVDVDPARNVPENALVVEKLVDVVQTIRRWNQSRT